MLSKEHVPRVLIFEDEEYWKNIFTEIVEDAGFIPLPYSDLRSARRALRTEEIAIALVDLYGSEKYGTQSALPEGLRLLRDIKQLYEEAGSGPLIIAVSGSDEVTHEVIAKISDYQSQQIVIKFFSKGIDFDEVELQNVLKRAARNRYKTGNVANYEDDMNYSIEKQSWYVTEYPTIKEVEYQKIQNLEDEIDVVLITATEEEINAVLNLVSPYPHRRKILKTSVGPETYFLGKFGYYRAVITKCRMGAIGEGSVILATNQAQRIWRPRAVVMTGIAFGKDPFKQAIGDVIVASQIISYEQQRQSEKEIFRGPIIPSNTTLLNRFENASDWHFSRPDGKTCKIHIGPVLSGEKLVDDPEFKAGLFERYPQAIGGEMEGAGLCAAAGRIGTAWILVKSICDWGDGNKHDRHQPLAAAAAASLVHHVFSQKGALNSINKPVF